VDNKNNTARAVFAHVTVGMQLAITMLVFVYGGRKLDLYLDKSPIFLAVGTVLGMTIGFYHLMKNLQSDDLKNKKMKEKNVNNKRIKWN
jgi:F0F1-type ATP synthase assembly protein I